MAVFSYEYVFFVPLRLIQNSMKPAQIFHQYIWIINTLRAYRKLTLNELNQKWQEDGVADGNPLPRASFNRHRDAIHDMFGIDIFGEIRTCQVNNQIMFVGKDVATALGYSNSQKAIRDHVDSEDKGVNEMVTPGGTQKVVFINESGLYSLILSSKLPQAKAFKRCREGGGREPEHGSADAEELAQASTGSG